MVKRSREGLQVLHLQNQKGKKNTQDERKAWDTSIITEKLLIRCIIGLAI